MTGEERIDDNEAPNRVRSLLWGASVVVVLALVTIAYTWPLLPNLDRALSDPGDPLILTWTLHHDWWATTHHPSKLFEAPIFWPSHDALAFSEHIYGIAVFGFPLFAAGMPPITVYNILVLVGFVLSGVGAYVLARVCGASRFGSLIGAIFYTIMPFRMMHLTHLQHVWTCWIPLTLAALLLFVRKPTRTRAVLFGAAFFMNGWSNVHWLLFLSFTVAVTIAFALLLHRRTLRELVPLIVALVVASALLVPFLLPYKRVEKRYHMRRGEAEVAMFSATPIDWFRAPFTAKLYTSTDLTRTAPGERALFPGFVVLLLSVVGAYVVAKPPLISRRDRLIRSLDLTTAVSLIFGILGVMSRRVIIPYAHCRAIIYRGSATFLTIAVVALLARLWLAYPGQRRNSLRESLMSSRFSFEWWSAIVWIVIGFIGSLGLNAFLHTVLYHHVDAFAALRVPARWAIITYTGLMVTAALGVTALVARTRGWRRVTVAVVMAAALLVEMRTTLMFYLVEPKMAPVYQWIATLPNRALVEFPFGGGWDDYDSMLRSTFHHKPIVNGASGFEPPVHAEIANLLATNRTESLTPLLQRINCPFIVVHKTRLGGQSEVVRSWIDWEVAAKRLVLLRHFDEELEGVWVFAVRSLLDEKTLVRIAPDANRPDLIDTFASRREYLPSGTFGRLDVPSYGESMQGRFGIFGWALSPKGIRSVEATFDYGRHTVTLPLMTYTPLRRHFPSLAFIDKPAFGAVLDAPPGGRAGHNDMEVVVIDGEGARHRLTYVPFDWKPDRSFCARNWNVPQLRGLFARIGASDEELRRSLREDAAVRIPIDRFAMRLANTDDTIATQALYQALVDRQATAEEVASARNDVRRGKTREDLARGIMNSDEFARRYLRRSAPDRPDE